uniref:Peptidase M12B propeptide domain-containing protein n=1 Tax=Monopterus albus TaxID=43700 RepID=A0A3Q3IJI1_MONAL
MYCVRFVTVFAEDTDSALFLQVSYVVGVDGSDHVVHLERNELLLPADFTVFTYSRNGSLITSTPPVQVTHTQCSFCFSSAKRP